MLIFALLLVIISGSAISLTFISKINDVSSEVADNWMPSIIVSESINTETSEYRIKEYAHIIATDTSSKKARESEIKEIGNIISDYFNQYEALITNDTDKNLMQTAKDLWNEYTKYSEQIISLSNQNRTTEAMDIITNQSNAAFTEASEALRAVVDFNKTNGDTESRASEDFSKNARTITIISAIIVAIIALIINLYIIFLIMKPIRLIDDVAEKVSAGNLNETINYKSRDELGVLSVNFNETIEKLRDYINYINEIADTLDDISNGNLLFSLKYEYTGEFKKVKVALEALSDSLNNTLGQINQSAEQVTNGAEQVAGGAQTLSQGATEQAASVEELAARINEISEQTKINAENAAEAGQKMQNLGNEIEISNEQMQQMIEAMNKISKSSDEIGRIIKTIEDIALQTNILSLNAAVEAARVGDAGKGFAVVADEVRNLAGKSAEAASNTSSLIETSLNAVRDGNRIANETAKSLERVVEETRITISNVEKISVASQSQSEAVSQVSEGVDQISSVIQNTSATAQQSAATSQELSGQAQVLRELIGRFKLKGSDYSSSNYDNNNSYEQNSYDSYEQNNYDSNEQSDEPLNIDLVYENEGDSKY